MKKLIWILCLAMILCVFPGCQAEPTGTQPAGTTEPAGIPTRQTEGVADIRPLPPENPGSSLIEYDPDRTIYIGSEHVYMDFYPGITRLPSFYFYIFSRQPLDSDSISVTFPVDLPFVVHVNHKDYVQRKTDAMIEAEGGGTGSGMPYYVYQAYRGVSFEGKQGDDVYTDFAALKESDLPEFYVYSVVVGLINIESLNEAVVLEKLDVTIEGEVYEAKLGRVRLLPAEAFPSDARVVRVKGLAGNGCQPYNDGITCLMNVLELQEVEEDITLTGLYMAEEESRILDISVELTSGGQSVQIQWDGKTPIQVYKGDSLIINAIIKNPHAEKLLNYVMCHTVIEFINSDNEKVCAVNTQVGSEGRNLHEHYAIIFDGVDMEPYYRNYFYRYTFEFVEKFRGK